MLNYLDVTVGDSVGLAVGALVAKMSSVGKSVASAMVGELVALTPAGEFVPLVDE